jgi:hypothetical protein
MYVSVGITGNIMVSNDVYIKNAIRGHYPAGQLVCLKYVWNNFVKRQ